MKKLIGIILAVCMLFTVAAAANTITQNGDPALDTTNRTVTVKFTGIPGTEQATLFAYEVKDAMITEATPIPAFVSNEATPIKGIDQATVSTITTTEGETTVSSFTFKVAADYVGKMVVKVGGTDAAPISMLVEFKAAVTPGPGEGGEGGETPVDPPVNPPVNPDEITITVQYGDVNGDGEANEFDASLILQKGVGLIEIFVDQQDREIPDAAGDVNGDGEANEFDASLILQKGVGLVNGFTDQTGNALTTYTYTYVAPAQ